MRGLEESCIELPAVAGLHGCLHGRCYSCLYLYQFDGFHARTRTRTRLIKRAGHLSIRMLHSILFVSLHHLQKPHSTIASSRHSHTEETVKSVALRPV